MNLHACLPQTLTQENLAAWITKNSIETREHIDKIPLTPEKIKELEHKSSVASRAIDELKDVEKQFKAFLKKGTDVDFNTVVPDGQEPKRLPQTITIPPTNGLDVLNERREWADRQIRMGYSHESRNIYHIPYSETGEIIGVDIEGNEMEDYSRAMTEEEAKKFTLPLANEIVKVKKVRKPAAEETFEI
jgi:hypothetical protein